ncbi:MAG TPA: uroporphyrinogen decarboxylase family protein [Planctomycetota bacterium]|nr:uroporphyrinogen decarboxylase family protein [Planctomycetota bacterium]HRR78712.1 uroporphyrinogen decarboxylase family protein [Planctomycetota bacterium]HRT93820.1 uroporphyrinogen decarboxylase family protein [Planctomycetota bacterium]
MSHREWIQRVLRHEAGLPVPWNLSLSPPARQKLAGRYGPGEIEDILDLPLRLRGPNSIKPLYASPREFGPTARDEWGVVWTTSDVDRGSPVGPPVTRPDLHGFVFPDPAAPHRFEGLAAWCERHRGCYTILWIGDLWERATFLCGMENLLLWAALEPSFVHALLERIAAYVMHTLETLLERLIFDGVALSDDYGTQRGLLLSPGAWRAFVKPHLARLFGRAKAAGKSVFLHSCGHVRPIVPDLVDLGLDILHPVQPEAMDIGELKREFGRHLSFCGGLGTQHLMARASPAEVQAEVRRLQRTMGAGGGYILETGITLQADVPLANLLAMIDAARQT